VDLHRFVILPRAMTGYPSRRNVLRGLVGAGLGLGGARLPEGTAARKKRKRKVRRNAFGCVNVGDSCKNARQCCSGICKGKQGRKTCRAHNVDVCRAGQREDSCGGATAPCAANGIPGGFCATTTGNAGYCRGDITCSPCTKDVECVSACGVSACGVSAACIRCEAGCPDTGGTACVGFGLCQSPE
jgi:hypothetical protein